MPGFLSIWVTAVGVGVSAPFRIFGAQGLEHCRAHGKILLAHLAGRRAGGFALGVQAGGLTESSPAQRAGSHPAVAGGDPREWVKGIGTPAGCQILCMPQDKSDQVLGPYWIARFSVSPTALQLIFDGLLVTMFLLSLAIIGDVIERTRAYGKDHFFQESMKFWHPSGVLIPLPIFRGSPLRRSRPLGGTTFCQASGLICRFDIGQGSRCENRFRRAGDTMKMFKLQRPSPCIC